MFKQAIVTPLLKKPGLDQSDPSNYRPISNLNNISKLLERLFLFRFQSHVSNSPNFNPLQSAYCRFHSTYLADRVQRVVVGQSKSTDTSLSTGVPQGSVLGPILFSVFTSPVGHIISSSGIHHQQYADDTQLFISLTSSSGGSRGGHRGPWPPPNGLKKKNFLHYLKKFTF